MKVYENIQQNKFNIQVSSVIPKIMCTNQSFRILILILIKLFLCQSSIFNLTLTLTSMNLHTVIFFSHQ